MSAFQQEYCGCSKLKEISRLQTLSVDPQSFFVEYVATRSPVVFEDFIGDSEWLVSKESWSLDKLKERTPADLKVKVEYRDDDAGRFGMGKEKRITFHKFLSELESGSTNFYMTTQDLEYDLEDQPEIISAPLTALTGDFPLIPSLFGNLVVSNINVWMGRTSTWTTSGLHHDYHDNLYIMVKGQKQVTLISPAYAEDLYTVGTIEKIHPNGRINYVGQPTFADGRSLEADKAWSAAQKLKRTIQNTKDIHHSGGRRFGHRTQNRNNGSATANQSEDEKCENLQNSSDVDEEEGEDDDDIDRALEEVLNAEHDDDFDDDEDDDFDENDDFDDEEEEGKEEEGDEDNASDFGDDNNEKDKVKKRNIDKLSGIAAENSVAKKAKHENTSEPSTTTTRPENFSQVDTSLSLQELKERFPRYVEAAKTAITVTLQEGEMLFIPAGWFHEVKSQGSEGHIAFNYWFHPPDQLDNYQQPYSSEFWPSVFASKLQN